MLKSVSERRLNEKMPLSSYFAPGWDGFAALLLLPALAAALLRWLIDAGLHYFPRLPLWRVTGAPQKSRRK